jgi:hypothetical protein
MLPLIAVIEVLLVAYGTVGALIASRRPENAIGWIFCALGLALAVASVASGYADYGLYGGGPLPAPELAAWLNVWLYILVLFVGPCLLFLLFPDGHPPSARWRPVIWLVAASGAGIFLTLAFSPGELDKYTYPGLANPLAIGGGPGNLLTAIESLSDDVPPIIALVCIAAMISRFWWSGGRERLQLKWVVYTATLTAMSFLIGFALPASVPRAVEDALFFFGLAAFAAIPVAVGVAILQYRLYDIDVLINRTLVYGALTATLVGIYFGSVVLLQYAFRTFTGDSQLFIVASTLLIAALFNPLRQRIQSLVDRRFYRQKYDAARTLEAFGRKLRNVTDLEVLGEDLVRAVNETMQPVHASIWLREPPSIDTGGSP